MYNKLFFWNVRGLNDPDKHKSFCDWLAAYQSLFGSILETHIKDHNLSHLMNKICRGWKFTSNHADDADGRIVIILKDTVSVRVLQQSRQAITCQVQLPGYPLFVYTAIYASNEKDERTDLWVELLNMCSTLSLNTILWVLGGDFNQIIHPSEHSLSHVNSFTHDMIELKDCLSQLGVYDLRYQGSPSTWTNRQPHDPIAKKLDRLLINNPILNIFPHCLSFFHPTFTSDHSPCIFDLATKIPAAGNRPFKFYNYLTEHPDFLQVVFNTWTRAGSTVWNLTDLY